MLACAARAHLYQRLAEEALRRASLLCDPGARHLLKRRKGANRAGFAFPLTGSPHQAEIITLVDSSSVMSSVPGRADPSSRSQLSPRLPALPQEPRIRMHGALLPGSGHPSASKAVCAEVLAEGGSTCASSSRTEALDMVRPDASHVPQAQRRILDSRKQRENLEELHGRQGREALPQHLLYTQGRHDYLGHFTHKGLQGQCVQRPQAVPLLSRCGLKYCEWNLKK